LVVEAEIFPTILSSLRDSDEYVQKNVATLIREIAKHTPEVFNYKNVWTMNILHACSLDPSPSFDVVVGGPNTQNQTNCMGVAMRTGVVWHEYYNSLTGGC